MRQEHFSYPISEFYSSRVCMDSQLISRGEYLFHTLEKENMYRVSIEFKFSLILIGLN